MREFMDSSGTAWRVWNTRPSRGGILDEEFRDGWLTFESNTHRRRLAPIPAGWETVSEARLDLMCRVALVVSQRPTSAESWSDDQPGPQHEQEQEQQPPS